MERLAEDLGDGLRRRSIGGVGLQVYFCRKAAARTAQRLAAFDKNTPEDRFRRLPDRLRSDRW